MCSLVNSKVEGKLPKLRTLDIVSFSCNFHLSAIMNYYVRKESNPEKSSLQFLFPVTPLNHLQELTFSVDPWEEFAIRAHWPRLKRLGIACMGETNTEKIRKEIAEAFEGGLLPNLQTVVLFVETIPTPSFETERLNKHGIVLTIMKLEDRKYSKVLNRSQ